MSLKHFLNTKFKRRYSVTFAVYMDGAPAFQHELFVVDYNRRRAKRQATGKLFHSLTADVVNCHISK